MFIFVVGLLVPGKFDWGQTGTAAEAAREERLTMIGRSDLVFFFLLSTRMVLASVFKRDHCSEDGKNCHRQELTTGADRRGRR